MKSFLTLIVIFSLLPVFSSAQTAFEEGYFITKEGERVESLIKNKDWGRNPDSFQFRMVSDGSDSTRTVESVKEFGIYGKVKYVGHLAQIDRSPNNSNKLSDTFKPDFEQKEVFLKVLVEGKATLYEYTFGSGIDRYFMKVEGGEIEALVYKKYYAYGADGIRRVAENKTYINQMGMANIYIDCREKQPSLPRYRGKEMVRYFIQYNECFGEVAEVYDSKDKGQLIITPRIGVQNLNWQYKSGHFDNGIFGPSLLLSDPQSTSIPRLALQIETVLPSNHDVWSILFETAYVSYLFSNKYEEFGFSNIELGGGFRRYFYINNKKAVFFNGMANYPIVVKELGDYRRYKGTGAFAVGLGLMMNGANFETRYDFKRGIGFKGGYPFSTISGWSLTFGYNLFDNKAKE